MNKNNNGKEIILCESSLNKMITHAIREVLKEQQINEKEVEKFTPYEKGSGPERFKKAFYNGNPETRNPAYAAALKDKKKLEETISRAVKKAIKESYEDLDRQQYNLWKMVAEYLEKTGYPTWGGYRNNPYVLKVSINEYGDVNKIKSMLTQLLGIDDPIDLSTKYETNQIGRDQRAVIYLPGVNKTKFAQEQIQY